MTEKQKRLQEIAKYWCLKVQETRGYIYESVIKHPVRTDDQLKKNRLKTRNTLVPLSRKQVEDDIPKKEEKIND